MTHQKKRFPNNSSIVVEVCLPCRWIETAVFLSLRACSFPRNLFTKSLRSNECLLWLRYSGFQALCHIAPFLRPFVPNGLQSYHFFSEGCASSVLGLTFLPVARFFLPNVRPFRVPCRNCPWSAFSVPSVRPSIFYDRVPYAIPFLHYGSFLCGKRPISSGTHHCPGSFLRLFGGALRLDADPHAASSVLQKFPLRPLP
jgi:hypothetical protein